MPRKPSIRKNSPQTETQPTVPPVTTVAVKPTPIAVAPSTNGPVLATENKIVKPLAKAAAAAAGAPSRPAQDAIRQRAYEIYQQRGSTGNPIEDWLRAERELMAAGDQRKPA